MKFSLKYSLCAAAVFMSISTSSAHASYCGDGRTINFAQIGWESGSFITEVMKTILAAGYDCKVDTVTGNSVTLEQAAADGDVQISAEEWMGRSDVWKKAAAEGKVIGIGNSFEGAEEGWFVPDYLIHGDPARNIAAVAPDLKRVDQLADPKYVALFSDPEEPAKGRFLNCPSGWTCESISTAKLQAYGLESSYVNFRPGTGTALDSAITSAYLQGQPILFYYWSPTAIMGKFKLVKLEEAPYSDACWAGLTSTDGKHDKACAFPTTQVVYGVNAKFATEAPEIIDILKKAEFPLKEINLSLAYMLDNKAEPVAAAKEFLKTKKDIWTKWVSKEAAEKIEAGLN
jgi:glycine betaine/proline transport system substrate-binding protein